MISVEESKVQIGLERHEYDCKDCHGRGVGVCDVCIIDVDIQVYKELLEYRNGTRRNPMTLEELKKAADELGYNVVKKTQPLPKLLDCSCGKNCRSISLKANGHVGRNGRFLKCVCCGLEGDAGKTKREIYENWNRAVLESKAK